MVFNGLSTREFRSTAREGTLGIADNYDVKTTIRSRTFHPSRNYDVGVLNNPNAITFIKHSIVNIIVTDQLIQYVYVLKPISYSFLFGELL